MEFVTSEACTVDVRALNTVCEGEYLGRYWSVFGRVILNVTLNEK